MNYLFLLIYLFNSDFEKKMKKKIHKSLKMKQQKNSKREESPLTQIKETFHSN